MRKANVIATFLNKWVFFIKKRIINFKDQKSFGLMEMLSFVAFHNSCGKVNFPFGA